MLRTRLIHPEILDALGRAGHGSQVLIADGNYPFSTGAPAEARRVYLNLMPGLVAATDVLDALLEAIVVEAAAVMVPPDGAMQPIHSEFAEMLPFGLQLKLLPRFEFYAKVRTPDTCLVIATGERRRFANLLLTIGTISGAEA